VVWNRSEEKLPGVRHEQNLQSSHSSTVDRGRRTNPKGTDPQRMWPQSRALTHPPSFRPKASPRGVRHPWSLKADGQSSRPNTAGVLKLAWRCGGVCMYFKKSKRRRPGDLFFGIHDKHKSCPQRGAHGVELTGGCQRASNGLCLQASSWCATAGRIFMGMLLGATNRPVGPYEGGIATVARPVEASTGPALVWFGEHCLSGRQLPNPRSGG